MEPSGFDYVARQVPLYRDLLLSLPQWVKEQAFDFHFSAGQPISLCGREGICFLVGRGCVSRCPQDAPPVTSQQIRELFYKSAAIPCMPTRRSSARAMCAWGRAAG